MTITTDDYVAILNVLGRYCLAYDGHDADAMAEVFAEDGVLENPERRLEGTAAFRDLATIGDRSLIRHVPVPLVVEVDGDSAHVTSYVVTVAGPYARRFGVDSWATFEDTLVRADGRWRIKHRTILRPHHDDWDRLRDQDWAKL